MAGDVQAVPCWIPAANGKSKNNHPTCIRHTVLKLDPWLSLVSVRRPETFRFPARQTPLFVQCRTRSPPDTFPLCSVPQPSTNAALCLPVSNSMLCARKIDVRGRRRALWFCHLWLLFCSTNVMCQVTTQVLQIKGKYCCCFFRLIFIAIWTQVIIIYLNPKTHRHFRCTELVPAALTCGTIRTDKEIDRSSHRPTSPWNMLTRPERVRSCFSCFHAHFQSTTSAGLDAAAVLLGGGVR